LCLQQEVKGRLQQHVLPLRTASGTAVIPRSAAAAGLEGPAAAGPALGTSCPGQACGGCPSEHL